MEETRKKKLKKIGDVEARSESGEEKASDWVNELAYFSWRDKLHNRDFIGERGFNKWISPF